MIFEFHDNDGLNQSWVRKARRKGAFVLTAGEDDDTHLVCLPNARKPIGNDNTWVWSGGEAYIDPWHLLYSKDS